MVREQDVQIGIGGAELVHQLANPSHGGDQQVLLQAVAELSRRVAALERRERAGTPPSPARPLSVLEVCRALGIGRRTFYTTLAELQREGLVELPRVTRRRRFTADSVARVIHTRTVRPGRTARKG